MLLDIHAGDVEGFGHVRILIGLITGLSITRILSGLSRSVQNPGRNPACAGHLIWVFFMLIYVTHFWWFQFQLSSVSTWEYSEYVFVLFYAALIFFISSLLFPDELDRDRGFAEYFSSKSQWIFGLLAALFLVDIADSAIKGTDHFRSLGAAYPFMQAVLSLLAMIGIFSKGRWYPITLAYLPSSTNCGGFSPIRSTSGS